MRIEGVSRDLDPKIDFSEWNWDDFETVFKPIADRVAEVLWDEIVDSIKDKDNARISMDFDGRREGKSDGELCLTITLIEDNATLVVPLKDISIDDEGMWLTKDQPEFAYDFEPMLAKLNEARAILRHWDEQLQRIIAETMDEMAKERLP